MIVRQIVKLLVFMIKGAAWSYGDNVHLDKLLSGSAEKCGLAAKFKAEPDVLLTDGYYSKHWRRVTVLELSDCQDCYEVVSVWRGLSTVLVQFDEGDESGDWSQYIQYCFARKGPVKHIISDFNFLSESWSVLQEFSLKAGKLVKTREYFRDLDDWHAVPHPPTWDDYRPYREVPPFVRLGQTPFFGLLK